MERDAGGKLESVERSKSLRRFQAFNSIDDYQPRG